MQDGRAVRGPVKARSNMLGLGMIRDRKSIILGNFPLVCRQDIHSKAFSGVKVGVGSGFVVNTHEYQWRIERHRTKRISSHSMNLALRLDTDYGDPGCEAPQRAPKIILCDHVKDNQSSIMARSEQCNKRRQLYDRPAGAISASIETTALVCSRA